MLTERERWKINEEASLRYREDHSPYEGASRRGFIQGAIWVMEKIKKIFNIKELEL